MTATAPGIQPAVRIDHDLCSGARNCQHRYGQVFLVDRGKAWIRPGVDWADVDVARLHDVEDGCPWGAIEVAGPAAAAPGRVAGR